MLHHHSRPLWFRDIDWHLFFWTQLSVFFRSTEPLSTFIELITSLHAQLGAMNLHQFNSPVFKSSFVFFQFLGLLVGKLRSDCGENYLRDSQERAQQCPLETTRSKELQKIDYYLTYMKYCYDTMSYLSHSFEIEATTLAHQFLLIEAARCQYEKALNSVQVVWHLEQFSRSLKKVSNHIMNNVPLLVLDYAELLDCTLNVLIMSPSIYTLTTGANILFTCTQEMQYTPISPISSCDSYTQNTV